MKTLLLLRHGKAVSADPTGDRHRSLNDRGRGEAVDIGGMLGRLGLLPDLALVSDSRRTRETAELALPDLSEITRFEPRLYEASSDQILGIVRESAGAAKRVLVVGHNPGIGELARALEGAGDPQAAIGLQDSFPTGALAVLEFDARDWAEVAKGTGTLTRFVVPDRSGSA